MVVLKLNVIVYVLKIQPNCNDMERMSGVASIIRQSLGAKKLAKSMKPKYTILWPLPGDPRPISHWVYKKCDDGNGFPVEDTYKYAFVTDGKTAPIVVNRMKRSDPLDKENYNLIFNRAPCI